MFALRSLRPPRACARALGSIAANSPEFSVMRAGGAAFVDKTGAIADLLNYAKPGNAHRVFFSRPRKFGKSLTLSIAAEMLAAGKLPQGVAAWPGYAPVDVPALFGGLQVHQRLLAGDATLRGLLQRPHFVVKLGLGEAQTGAQLCAVIKESIADIAEQAFGEKVSSKVMARTTPSGALGSLVAAVPSAVPVALLVDEYDAAIIQDVTDGDWSSANDGIKALRSLFMSTKSPVFGSRIERCLVTGVVRFAHTSLFSGANNFKDLTGDPLLSRVLGFSAAEIRATFPEELERLAKGQGTDVSGAMQQLAHWYNGYCFDGASTCFNPFPVLGALEAGRITGEELQGASSYLWLGVPPAALLDGLGSLHLTQSEARIDIADIKAQVVCAAPLLLQTGLLTLVPGGNAFFSSGTPVDDSSVLLAPPNEFARSTLRTTATRMVGMRDARAKDLTAIGRQMQEALQNRDHASFQGHLLKALSSISSRTTKDKMLAPGATPPPREAPYHTFLHGLLLGVLEPSVGLVSTEVASAQGDADIVLQLRPGLESGAFPSAVWILEVGLGSTDSELRSKVEQGKAYAKQYAAVEVMVCAVLVNKTKGEFRFSWEKRGAGTSGA
jgi:hypothetical protein